MLIYDKPLLKVAAQSRVEMFSEKKDETTLILITFEAPTSNANKEIQ